VHDPRATYREKVIACERGGTFKYFLLADRVAHVWAALAAQWGPPAKNAAFATMEIGTPALIVRSTLLGNPLTVFRKRACTDADIATLHRLLEFRETVDA
jgi:hypothetical protein